MIIRGFDREVYKTRKMIEHLTLIAAIIVVAFIYNWVKDVRPPDDFFN